jgi:RimJ/RimL family protein N-acetyltransferase
VSGKDVAKLEGKRIALRDFLIEDIESVYDWICQPDITRYLVTGSLPKTLRETEAYVERQMARTDPLNHAFVIMLRADASSIGITACHNIDWPNRVAEVGIIIGEPEQLSRGYGTEALMLLLGYSFDRLNLHRVFLRVLDFNQRAIESYLKCGFSKEGRLRDAVFLDGDYHDVIVMSILEEEFFRLRR